MIIDYFYAIALSLLQSAVFLFPAADSGTISYVENGASNFADAINSVDVWVPVSTFWQVLGYIVTIEAGWLALYLVLYFLKKFRATG